jgi:hypothetical protein
MHVICVVLQQDVDLNHRRRWRLLHSGSLRLMFVSASRGLMTLCILVAEALQRLSSQMSEFQACIVLFCCWEGSALRFAEPRPRVQVCRKRFNVVMLCWGHMQAARRTRARAAITCKVFTFRWIIYVSGAVQGADIPSKCFHKERGLSGPDHDAVLHAVTSVEVASCPWLPFLCFLA